MLIYCHIYSDTTLFHTALVVSPASVKYLFKALRYISHIVVNYVYEVICNLHSDQSDGNDA
jgi:hypothetical protein